MSKAIAAAFEAAKGCQKAADALLGGATEACKESRGVFALYLSAYNALREAQRACSELTDALCEEEEDHD